MTLSVLENIRKSAIDMAQGAGLVALDIPERLRVRPVDPWGGCAEAGRLLCDGVFTLGEQQIALHGECWEPVASAQWLEHLHGFSWLRDLRSCGGESARQQARALIASWVRQYPKAHPLAWRPDIMGARLAQWIALHEFFNDSFDEDFQDISMVKLLVTNFFLFTLPLGLLQAIFMGIYFGSPLATFIPGGIAGIISTAILLFKHIVGKYIIWFQALLPIWLVILPVFSFPIWSFINYKIVTLVLQII